MLQNDEALKTLEEVLYTHAKADAQISLSVCEFKSNTKNSLMQMVHFWGLVTRAMWSSSNTDEA
jgi:hypothetical protein